MRIEYQPWQYMFIDNFLPQEEFDKHVAAATSIKQSEGVAREILDYDPMPDVPALLDKFAIHRRYRSLKKFIHYAVTPANFVHPKHVDAPFKIMSAVLYLAPQVNYGTTVYKDPNSLAVSHVKWKPNRLFVFCGLDDVTWHDYSASSTRYTLNYFLVDPTVIENQEYAANLVD